MNNAQTRAHTPRLSDTVGALVAERPARSRIFQQLGIDFCCGGKKPVEQACREKGLDPATVLAMLDLADAGPSGEVVDAAAMSMTELADHIEATHHAYLRRELPRLQQMIDKVSAVHGDHFPWVREIQGIFRSFRDELASHMMKEEQVLFPMIRQIDASDSLPAFHCGSIANPIRMMEHEHDSAGNAMGEFDRLSSGYTPPAEACNTFRAMLDGLRELEQDMHQHVHKENNVLFPRAMEREQQLRTG